MSENNIHKLVRAAKISNEPSATLQLLLYSNSDDRYHPFHVSAQMKVGTFLELALARLAEGDGAQRVEALRNYYQPVLELQDEGRELPQQTTLAEAGIADGTVCRIAARPLKERIMFCSYG